MRWILVLLCLIMTVNGALAQDETLEEVLIRINSLDHESQVDQLNIAFKTNACNNPKLALALHAKISELLFHTPYHKGEVKALGYYAYYQYCQSHLDSALFYFKQAAKTARSYQLHAEQTEMLKNVGNVFLTKGVYDSSLHYFDIATAICQDKKDTTHLAAILMGRGIAHQNSGDLAAAMSSYLEAEKIADQQADINASIMARLNRFTILSEHFPEQLNKAEFIATLQSCQENDLQHAEATVLQFLGEIELDSGRFDAALAYYEYGIDVSNEIGRVDLKIYHIEGAASTYLQKGEHQKAIDLAQQGIEIAEKSDMMPNAVRMYTLLAHAHLGAKGYDTAIVAALKSLQLATQQADLIEDQYKANQVLAEAYLNKGDFEKAFAAQKKYAELKSDVLNAEKSKQLSELQIKYETEKVTAERVLAIERAEFAESESQKNLQLFIGATVIAILIVVASIFYFAKLRQAKKVALAMLQLKSSQQQLALQKQYRDSELKALKAQMNPHFIFNVLNSIQEFIVLNQKDLASEYLATFAELIRSYLHFSNQGYISMPEEIDNLKKYLELEALRFGEQFHYHIHVSAGVDNESNHIPTMIVQPYVENAIKHGLFHKKGDKKMTLSFSFEQSDVIKCIIEDDGIGRDRAKHYSDKKNQTFKSFASEATASRLELLNQMSQSQIGVETIDLYKDDQSVGTKVILTIPLIED